MKKILTVSMIILIFFISISSPVLAKDEDIKWTKEELDFMEQHKVIRIGVDPGFVPFEFLDENGEHKGIAADYLEIITQKTGLTFEVQKDLSWPQAYEKAVAGDIDMLAAVSKTKEREQYFLFSEPYVFFKRVIVTRNDEKDISDIKDLENLSVAVQRNSSHHSYLQEDPKINLNLYDSVEVALTNVANGTERAFVGNLATTNYLIKKNGLTNLRFTSFEAQKEQALHFAVRKNWPQLQSIMNKAVDSISDEEKMRIQNKWISIDSDTDYSKLMSVVAMLAGVCFIVFIVSAYWIIKLKREIKERKRIQNDLEKAKIEAEEANQFKMAFMARMSHEIRTPLNAIVGMTYLIKKTQITLTQRMYVERIVQASNNMLSIINDILDFAKIESGKVELEVHSFSMDQVIQNVVNIVSYKIEEQKIGFHLLKDPLIPNWFLGDSKRIEQILINILNNAAKFTNQGEVVMDIRLMAKEESNYHLVFTIRDSGIGMSKDQINQLFQPFVQGDISINRRFGGSGLGLSIVKSLIDAMDGTIQVFSTVGEGSTFVIHLHLKVDEEKETDESKNMKSNQFSGIKALVLEKSGSSMNLIESYLRVFGLQCELTTSVSSAINLLENSANSFSKPFDLFIIDYDTPLEGGFEFVEALRNNQKIVVMPKILLLLPMMREDLFDQLKDHQIDIGVGKPIIPSALLNGVLSLFQLSAISKVQNRNKLVTISGNESVRQTILLVEDNKTNQLIVKSLTEQIGLECIIANDGKEGVEVFLENQDRIQLILMDLHMPVMNGYEASVEIRKHSEKVPIIAMTADVILGVQEKCKESGINQYISKPFDPERFIDLLCSYVHKPEKECSDYELYHYEAGLKKIGIAEPIYLQILQEYLEENSQLLEQLEEIISNKEYEKGKQIVHKVKSSSGSIGAQGLYETAIVLQGAFSNHEDEKITETYQKFSYLVHDLLDEITVIMKERT